MLLKSIFALGSVVATAFAAAYNDSGIAFEGYVDTTNGITYGFVFPPDAQQPASGAEFVGQIIATSSTVRWAGLALGGKMLNATLLVAWPSGSGITSLSQLDVLRTLFRFICRWIVMC